MEEALTEMELANRWKCTPKALRTMRRNGRAPKWWRVGKNGIRYSRKAVEEWERQNQC